MPIPHSLRISNPGTASPRRILRLLTPLALLAFTVAIAVPAQELVPGSWANQQIPPPVCFTPRPAWQGPSAPPCSPQSLNLWLTAITRWRDERRIRIGYNPAHYEMPALQWAQSAFIQPQMMVHDRTFYDPVAHKYTVGRYLDDLTRRYGGIDAVLIWATYPNLGIDDRNQLDMVRSMPGGIAGLRQMVADFHRRGVRVLFPMMMWDQGTRDPGQPWPDAIAALMKEINADGVNGDTQDGVPLAFSLAAEKIGHPLAFEPEGGPPDEEINWDVLTWGQYTFQFVPTVDRYRWLEPRHQVNIQGRWLRDKTDDLQFAFFNGGGWESWENVWGIWNGITPRDAEATRRVATIERAVAPFLVSRQWQPFYPMRRDGVFASRWPLGNQTLFTIVNRNQFNVAGPQMDIQPTTGMRYFDLYHGVELKPVQLGVRSVLEFTTEAHGYGAILATPGEPGPHIRQLMATMAKLTARPLSTYSHQWKPLLQTLVAIPPTAPAASAPPGMVRIPGGSFDFKVHGIELEGSDDIGVDVQYPWEDSPRRAHDHPMLIKSFYIDKYPVTNADFKKFLDASHYAPADPRNFLKDWVKGSYPSGAANKPVTWVSLEDARAYAAWAGKRLPHEWEWQYAAQGTDGRLYPWGNCGWLPPTTISPASASCAWSSDPKNLPAPIADHGRTMDPAANVDAHPRGVSPFGVMDMVGNVWQWTDEYIDDHTRAAILRGGSHYQPLGSLWYFPQAWQNNQHGKLLLMAPSYDRSAAIGFRCVKDAERDE